MKKINFLIVLAILCASTYLSAQELKVPKEVNCSYYDKENNEYYLFSNTNKYTIDLESFKIKKTEPFINPNFNLLDFLPIQLNDTFYFVDKLGGLVLKLENNELLRIDKSYAHNMQHESSIFRYNGAIYRYGGHGFFSARDFLLKFDTNTREWESVNLNSVLMPEARFANAYYIKDNSLYILGGLNVDIQDRKNRKQLTDFWKFSFEKKSWVKILSSKYLHKFNDNSFYFDNKVAFLGNSTDCSHLYLFDTDKYTYTKHTLDNLSNKADRSMPPFYYKGNMYFIFNRTNKERVLVHRPLNAFLGPIQDERTLQRSATYLIWWVLLGILIIAIVYFIVRQIIRYFTTIKLYPDKLKFKGLVLNIEEDEYVVLSKFIESAYVLENNVIQEIVDKPQYDRSHNVRLKNSWIESLNKKFQIIFKDSNKEFILKEASSYDKRFKKYTICLGKYNLVHKTN